MMTTLERSAPAVAELEAALRQAVRGDVSFDPGARALYATDASNYRQVPIGVVLPRSVDDAIATVETCRHFEVPVLSRGGGTSLAGQCCNVAVIIDFSRHMHHVLEIDQQRQTARVQPGAVLDDLRSQAERFHLTFGPDPATHNRCTLGGMIGNNSCGAHSVMAGMTDENIEWLDILTYDGLRLRVGRTSDEELQQILAEGGRKAQIYRDLKALADRYADAIRTGFPNIPRRVSGYNLPGLLPENGFHIARAVTGSEGTCVTVLEACVKLVHSPPERSLVMLGYPDIETACDRVPQILEHGPVALEGFDDRLIRSMKRKDLLTDDIKKLPPGGGWLLVEFGGATRQEADGKSHQLAEALKADSAHPSAIVVTDHHEQERMWSVRESALGGTAIVPGQAEMWPGWEDSAVPPERIGDYLRDLRQVLDRFGYDAAYYGHVGQGCIHMRVDFDFWNQAGLEKFRDFMHAAADLCVRYGGSLSGEHGDGQARGELLPKMFSPELMQAFREFKTIWDPGNQMNPGKVVQPLGVERGPLRMDEHLRLPEYRPAPQPTHFRFLNDGGSFAHAAMRCVGVGKCRREEAGTMCPSYMATREEQHSTRGRAHLLFEMLQGDVVQDGWRSEAVKDALDLCLACKGCKGECPVNVDMATYKAEFLSHYYAGRGLARPRSAYAFGLIMFWARIASKLPWLVNAAAHAPLLGTFAKQLVGMAPGREIPRFANQTFKSWFRSHRPAGTGRKRVILWPDTWTNYFQTDIARAAVEVLEAAGYEVRVPKRDLCCGRPLYDFGMLDLAKRLLRQVLETLEPDIRAGTPFVVLEPSCASVFRDELLDLFPNDELATCLAQQTVLLSELLAQDGTLSDFQLDGQTAAVVHGHCHHKAVLGFGDERKVLDQLGLKYRVLDSGCCGMAGAFGFEEEHYDVSMQVGERVLLPAVRQATPETLIVADGFSCREQISQSTGRQPVHLAQVLARALHRVPPRGSPAAPPTTPPPPPPS